MKVRLFSMLVAACAMAAGVLLCGSVPQVALAAENAPKSETIRRPGRFLYYGVPGYWMLQNPEVRKEIELVPEQAGKLQQIAGKYRDQLQELYAPLRNRELSQEERSKLFRQLAEKSRALLEQTRKEAEAVLLPHQMEALRMIEFRTRASAYLRNPAVLERLGLTEKQKEKIRRNREELAEKVSELQKKYFDELLKILTPEQIEKLKQPFAGGGRVISRPLQQQQ